MVDPIATVDVDFDLEQFLVEQTLGIECDICGISSRQSALPQANWMLKHSLECDHDPSYSIDVPMPAKAIDCTVTVGDTDG